MHPLVEPVEAGHHRWRHDLARAMRLRVSFARMPATPVNNRPIAIEVVDGFELIRRIRQWPERAIREVPAAALTAYARSEDRQRALRSGFHMHLAKPIDPRALVAAMAPLARRQT